MIRPKLNNSQQMDSNQSHQFLRLVFFNLTAFLKHPISSLIRLDHLAEVDKMERFDN